MKKMKKMKRRIILTFLLASLLAGCGSLPGQDSETDAKERDTSGADAYRRVEAAGDYAFDADGKVYSGGFVNPGHWTLTDKRVLGEDRVSGFRVSISGVGESYSPGAWIDATIYFQSEAEERSERGDFYGAMYFADVAEGGDAFGQEVTVRQYFQKKQGSLYAPVEMSRFGPETDGKNGGGREAENGHLEYYFCPQRRLPNLVAEGDTVSVVLDVSVEPGGEPVQRNLWEYTFSFDDPDAAPEETESDFDEEAYRESDPDYTKREIPGRWHCTDVRYIGGDAAGTSEDFTVTASRYGVQGQDFLYTYTEKGGKLQRYRIPEPYVADSYEPGGFYYEELKILYENEPDPAPGVRLAFAFSDVEFDAGEYGVKVSPTQFFRGGLPGDEYEAFGTGDDYVIHRTDNHWYYMSQEGYFPVGETDGEKIYLVLGAMDLMTKKCRMYNVYEFTWDGTPETVWDYNPAMAD